MVTDLTDIQGFAKQNDKIRYFLTVINFYFYFLWYVPFHLEDAKAITNAFYQVLTYLMSRYPRCLQTDKSKMVLNSD